MKVDLKRGPRGGIKRPIEIELILEEGDEVIVNRIHIGKESTVVLENNSHLTIRDSTDSNIFVKGDEPTFGTGTYSHDAGTFKSNGVRFTRSEDKE